MKCSYSAVSTIAENLLILTALQYPLFLINNKESQHEQYRRRWMESVLLKTKSPSRIYRGEKMARNNSIFTR